MLRSVHHSVPRVRVLRRFGGWTLCVCGLCALGMLPGARALGDDTVERRRLPVARVTAVRTAELSEDPTAFDTVIEVDEYAGEEKTVEQLLASSVGVQVRRFGGPGQASEMSIRGSTSRQVVVLLDGVRLNTAQSGTVDLSTIPLTLVDRIEVSRGGGAVWAGGGAMGGVVNIVTKKPTGRRQTSARLEGGTFGTWQGSLSQQGRIGDVDYGVGYEGFHTNGNWRFQSVEIEGDVGSIDSRELLRINNESDIHALLLQGGADLGDALRLSASNQVTFVSRGQPGPDTNSAAPDGGQSPDAHERRTRNVASVRLEAEELDWITEGLSGEARVSYLFERSHFQNPMPNVGFQREPIDVEQKNRAASLYGTADLERKWGPVAHLGHGAVDVRYESLSTDERDDAADDYHRRWTTAVTARDEMGILDERVTVSPSLRLDYTEGFGSEWLPHLGVIVSPWPWLRLKTNGERSYRAPALDELYYPDKGFIRGNPNLRPEKAWNADVGFEIGWEELSFVDDVFLEAVFFYQDIDNSIVFQRINTNTVAPTNTNDAVVLGVELAGSLSLFDWVAFSANWTWQDASLDQPQIAGIPGLVEPLVPSSGKALPGRADSEYHLRLVVGPPSGLFKLVGERSYTSKIHLDFSDNFTLSGRTVYDVSASLDVAQLWPETKNPWIPGKLIASVSVLNVTDRSVRDSVGFPQPGRSLTFGLEGGW